MVGIRNEGAQLLDTIDEPYDVLGQDGYGKRGGAVPIDSP